jgi:hypothetical protein
MDVSIRFDDSPRVFGALLVPQRAALVSRVGEAAFARAVASLPRVVREEYEALREDTWCRSETIKELNAAVAREAGVDARELVAATVHEAITGTVARIWRALLVMNSDDALLGRTPRFYARSYDRGSLTAARVGPGHSELVLDGWPDVPDLHAVAIAAGVRAVLMLAGRRHTRVVFRRNAELELVHFDVTWTA